MFGNNRIRVCIRELVCHCVHYSIYIEVYSSCVQQHNTNDVADRFPLYNIGALCCSSTIVQCGFFATMRGKMIQKGYNSSPTPIKHPWCLAALDPYKRHSFICLQGFFSF